jgi:pimeloyl-ACP methyl ester carboxylesterase
VQPLALNPRSSTAETVPDHITPYDRLAWSDDEVERLLVGGAQRAELEAYFGPQEYGDLRRLARAAARAPRRRESARVIIVPGIMGSQLGRQRRAPLPRDVLWLDPVDISFGRLTALRLPAVVELDSLGVVLYSYLRLKLQLRAAGLDPVFHHYDWRLSVEELGRRLAQRLDAEPSDKVGLVGHSLGGLVSRAALASNSGAKVERVVLLGTPNFGSFAAVQALRGTYAVVRKIARLDARHSAEALASEVFATFPSLYQILPRSPCTGSLDLFDAAAWPSEGPQPSATLLAAARELAGVLAPADARFAVIAGVSQETVTAITRRREQFVYTVTRHGDGTVPTRCALLPGAPAYYVASSHSELARNANVARAIADLLLTGSTRRLEARWSSASRASARIGDTALRRTHAGKVDWAALEPQQRRAFLQQLNEPPKLRLRVPRRRARSKVTSTA